MLKNVAKSQVLDRIRFENPWWVSGQVDPYYTGMPRRMYYKQFEQLANEQEIHRALVLMGPRRVGKTVMLYHWVQHLLDNKTNPRKIIFITIENPIYNNTSLNQLFAYALEAVGNSG